MAQPKKKLHLNWDAEHLVWEIKKAFNVYPDRTKYTQEQLREYLAANPDIETVLRYV